MRLVLLAALFLGSAPVAARDGDGGESRPASRPANPLQAADAKIRALKELERKLASKEPVDTGALEAEFAAPPRDADRRTRETRDQVSALEESWVRAREARAAAVERALARAAAPPEPAVVAESAPAPHPLAEVDPIRLASVLSRAGRHDRVVEVLAGVDGAEARYLEGRAFDALDRAEDAFKSYKKAKAEASGNSRLTAAITRAQKGLEWKTKFGRASDLIEPLRASSFSGFDSLRKVASPSKPNESAGGRNP